MINYLTQKLMDLILAINFWYKIQIGSYKIYSSKGSYSKSNQKLEGILFIEPENLKKSCLIIQSYSKSKSIQQQY